MQFNLELKEAQQKLMGMTVPLSGERLPLLNALGRVVLEEVVAKHDLPPYQQSAVDGFAVSENAPIGVQFRLQDKTITPDFKIGAGEAYAVVTGGLIPENTITVIPHEYARVEAGNISFSKEIKSGCNIKSVGEDLRSGTILAKPGTRVSAGLVSVMAAFGYQQVLVYRRPRVGILGLGKNVIGWQENPGPDEVRDSNGPLLASLVSGDGGEVTAVELAGNDSSILKSRVLELLEKIDVLIVNGGTHAEEYDEARAMLEDIGAKILYWGVKIRPGGHPGTAMWGSRMIICLSGNSGACRVGYHMLAAPVIRALQGLPPFYPSMVAVCTNSFAKEGGPRRLVRAHATIHEDGWRVAILPGQKSSMMRSSIYCNALIDLPAGHPPLRAGSEVSIILLDPDYSAINHKETRRSTGGEMGNGRL